MRNTKHITISILPELLKRADKLAQEEQRTRSELFREALRCYIEDRELQDLQRYARSVANKAGIETEEDVNRLVEVYRSEQSNA